jgi:hypothetical protein
MFGCVVPSESTSACTVVSRIASRSTSLTRSGWPKDAQPPGDQLGHQVCERLPVQHRIAALAPTTTLIVFSSSRIGCACARLPLDERDEEVLSPRARRVELGDSQTVVCYENRQRAAGTRRVHQREHLRSRAGKGFAFPPA